MIADAYCILEDMPESEWHVECQRYIVCHSAWQIQFMN